MMGFTLTDKFNDDKFYWDGKLFVVDMSFDNILRLFEMFDDKIIMQVEKPFIAIKMLVDNLEVEFNSFDEVLALFKYLLKEFLEIDIDDPDENNGQKVFDFTKDAEIIYASFLAEYGIDLFECHGKLHWKKFSALLKNLHDESKLKQVIGIRTMDIPSTDESSREYRDHIIKMKEEYSLDDRSREEKINDAFSDLASFFRGNKQ